MLWLPTYILTISFFLRLTIRTDFIFRTPKPIKLFITKIWWHECFQLYIVPYHRVVSQLRSPPNHLRSQLIFLPPACENQALSHMWYFTTGLPVRNVDFELLSQCSVSTCFLTPTRGISPGCNSRLAELSNKDYSVWPKCPSSNLSWLI